MASWRTGDAAGAATAAAITRTYSNPRNTPFRPIQDTSAFPCGEPY